VGQYRSRHKLLGLRNLIPRNLTHRAMRRIASGLSAVAILIVIVVILAGITGTAACARVALTVSSWSWPRFSSSLRFVVPDRFANRNAKLS
jgi:hypothetical protein